MLHLCKIHFFRLTQNWLCLVQLEYSLGKVFGLLLFFSKDNKNEIKSNLVVYYLKIGQDGKTLPRRFRSQIIRCRLRKLHHIGKIWTLALGWDSRQIQWNWSSNYLRVSLLPRGYWTFYRNLNYCMFGLNT